MQSVMNIYSHVENEVKVGEVEHAIRGLKGLPLEGSPIRLSSWSEQEDVSHLHRVLRGDHAELSVDDDGALPGQGAGVSGHTEVLLALSEQFAIET